jgi:hypothetical protein
LDLDGVAVGWSGVTGFWFVGLEDLSRDDLLVVVDLQQRQIAELSKLVAELQARVNRNSGNSSMPVCHEREGGARM